MNWGYFCSCKLIFCLYGGDDGGGSCGSGGVVNGADGGGGVGGGGAYRVGTSCLIQTDTRQKNLPLLDV